MTWQPLDKNDSTLLKGMAILLIVTHNFMHLFPSPKENQFDFDPQRVMDFLSLAYAEPENLIRFSLSFLGHFGVQVFVFLSAYGLIINYAANKPGYGRFLWQRWVKIFPAFLLAIPLWLLLEGWLLVGYGILGPVKLLYWNLEPLILKVLLISNFLPDYALPPVGPWWFIPFIFQFYLVFPLLHQFNSRFGVNGLLALSIASVLIAILTQGKIAGVNIYFTVLGHLPVFCLGIALATRNQVSLKNPWLLLTATFIVYILGNFYQWFWHISHIAFLILLLVAFGALLKPVKKSVSIRNVLMFFGNLSMPLFLVNGFTREPFISQAMSHDHWFLTLLFCLASLATATVVALVLSWLTKICLSNVNSESPGVFFNELGKKLALRNTAHSGS